MKPFGWIGKLSAGLLSSLILCAALIGCSGVGDDTIRIAVIPKGTAHVFWLSVHAGARTAAEELGVRIEWQGPQTETMRTQQIDIVNDFIVRQVDGIVLAPLDQEALVPAVDAIARAGIPCVIFDSGINSDEYVSFVATDNYQGGVQAGHALGQALGGEGTCIIVRTDPASDSTNQREQGFEDTLAEHYPGVQVIDSQYGYSDRERSRSVAEDMLTSHPDVDSVFGPNESSAFGALLALQSLGHAGEKVFVGFDSSDELVRGLENGHINALVLQDPFRMGYDSVVSMVKHLNGEPVERRIDTGVYVVTPENMNEPVMQRLLTPDLSILN